YQLIFPHIKEFTSPVSEIDDNRKFFLSTDNLSGYAIGFDGELTSLFSTVKGRGSELINLALTDGANHLDCFDGYLVKLYGKHGFMESKRVANWTPGGPDVVYMAI
ncbi:hypothetical protein JZU68_02205, partial [bacterium]|nr:hypothetical protein [bacterium]